MRRARIASLLITLLASAVACSPSSTRRGNPTSDENYVARDTGCTAVSFESADSTRLAAELCMPAGNGPFPAVVDLHPRICMGPAGIPPPWEQTVLPSWGYSVLVIDNFAARGLTARACDDINSLTSRQVIADAYGGLQFIAQDSRIDRKRIAMLAFLGSIGTAAIFADTIEARETFPITGGASFRAFFAFYPYCNFDFAGSPLHLYAPARIFVGDKDDMEPANRCGQLAATLDAKGADLQVSTYAGAESGFDLTSPDAIYPSTDRTALHPGGVTISTHPQYSPWSRNYATCTIRLKSIFDVVTPADVAACVRRGAHFQGNAEAADKARTDLKEQLSTLMNQ
jgi:dienelactone hydrolase